MKSALKILITAILSAALLTLGLSAELGRLDIELAERESGALVSGAELTLWKIADASVDGDSVSLAYTSEFAGCEIPLTDLRDSALGGRFAEFVAENSISGKYTAVSSNGVVSFESLEPALYLVAQTKAAEGFTQIEPYLVSIPSRVDGSLTYSAVSRPKTAITRLVELSVKKEWSHTAGEHPESVTVRLLRGDELVDTVVLSDANGWSFIWKDLPPDDSWRVEEVDIPLDWFATYSQSGLSFTITNSPGLLQTGGFNLLIPIFALLGLALISVGYVLVRRTEKDSNE